MDEMDEFDNIITLKDERGMDVSFEFLDLIEYQGNEYVVLLPAGIPDDEHAEVVILMVEDSDDSDEESYTTVENQDVLYAVYELFKNKYKDRFNFVE